MSGLSIASCIVSVASGAACYLGYAHIGIIGGAVGLTLGLLDTNAERDTKARKIGMAMGAGALVGGLIRILCY